MSHKKPGALFDEVDHLTFLGGRLPFIRLDILEHCLVRDVRAMKTHFPLTEEAYVEVVRESREMLHLEPRESFRVPPDAARDRYTLSLHVSLARFQD